MRRHDSVNEDYSDILLCSSYDELLKYCKQRLPVGQMKNATKRLGYRSKGSLSMFLRGHRVITRRGLGALASFFSWSDLQRMHAADLVQRRISVNPNTKPPDVFSKKQVIKQIELNPKQFSIFLKWYRAPLFLILSACQQFPGYEYLERKLRNKVPFGMIMNSIYALEKLGFIVRKGKSIKTMVEPYLSFSPESSSVEVQEYQRGMILRAYEAVHEQSADDRELQTISFSMDPNRIPEAKRVIREFVTNFDEHFAKQDSREICQLNVQMFWHTDFKV